MYYVKFKVLLNCLAFLASHCATQHVCHKWPPLQLSCTVETT